MSNEEAIKILSHTSNLGYGVVIEPVEGYTTRDIKIALDMAIESLGVRPQGEWIMQRHDLDGCFYTCSNCGRMIRVPLFINDPEDNETLADYPFCHCGASMIGGETE